MERAQPVLVVDLFPAVQEGLHDLLSALTPDDWQRRIDNWTVKDLALHLLGGDIGILSRKRDGQVSRPGKPIDGWDELVAFINEQNDLWVRAARRISPRLLCDLLAFTAPQVYQYFKSLDPFALGGAVSWAGREPAPIWLDLAREYTERWYHQQQIRDAVGKPGFRERAYFAPVLDTFVRALPHTFHEVDAVNGTAVTLAITGDAGNSWTVQRENGQWILYAGSAPSPDAEVILDQDVAWKLFTKGIRKEAAQAAIRGDQALGQKALNAVSIIA
jgi:uncharacterized protein (TIGR03083 family)